jgi:hypothetical protein
MLEVLQGLTLVPGGKICKTTFNRSYESISSGALRRKELCARASEESMYLSPDTLFDNGWKWVAQQEKNDPTYRVKRIGE